MSPRSRTRARLVRLAFLAALGCVGAVSAPGTSAAQPPTGREQAAAAFDEAVRAYEHGDFAAAASAFLRADSFAPNAEALTNALAAAKRAGDYLLVIEAAERLLSRADESEAAKVQARRARAEAAARLARVTFSCSPSPCSLVLDDRPVEPGERFLLPGIHRAKAAAPSGAVAARTLQLDAGATYSVALRIDVSPTVAPASSPATGSGPTKPPAPETTGVPPTAAGNAGLSPTWFYVGVGLTVALAGVTTWSGVDALHAKDDLGASPTQAAVDDVKGRMRRTDVWLAGSVVAGALTAWAGFELVQWNQPGPSSGSVALVPSGPGASLRGRF